MFDHEWEPIPTNLDDLQPGPELGGVLACYDIDEVSPHDRITVLRAQQRQCSFDNAQLYRTMASIANIMDDDHPQYGTDAAAAEIQCALHLTRRATETELGFALELQRRLPRVWDALFDGAIDVRRAKTFNHATLHLPVGVARDVVERVIEAAGGLTTGELKARLDRVVIEADPDGAQDRYQHAVKGRRLIAEASVDGTANLLGLDLPPHRVNAASRRVNHIAKSLKTKDETRTMDQIRADVYLDLLLGKPSEGPNAESTSGSTWTPSVPSPNTPANSPATAPSSPTSPDKPSPSTWILSGDTPSSTMKVEPSTTAPPDAAPPPHYAATSKPETKPVSSPAAACRRSTVTSTTPPAG